MVHIFFITFLIFPFLWGGGEVYGFLMESLTCLVLFLCCLMTQSLFIFYLCVVKLFNRFRKNNKCMTQKQKWYATLTFVVWILTNHTIITWNPLTSVINFGMCTKLITGCVSTSGGGIFYFGGIAFSLSMCRLITKQFVRRAIQSPSVIISFSVLFAWKMLTPLILAVTNIWFQRFNAEA